MIAIAPKTEEKPKIDKEQQAYFLNQERIQILVAKIKQARQLRNIASSFNGTTARSLATKQLGMTSAEYKSLQSLLSGYENVVGQIQQHGVEDMGMIDSICLSLPEEYLTLGVVLPEESIDALVTAAQNELELLPSACEKIILEGLAKREIGTNVSLEKPTQMATIKKLLAALSNCPAEWKEVVSAKMKEGVDGKKATKLTSSWNKIRNASDGLGLDIDPTSVDSPEKAAQLAKVVSRAKSILGLAERAETLETAKQEMLGILEGLLEEFDEPEIQEFITSLANKI